jgi:para-aminobenzoate synthetase component II
VKNLSVLLVDNDDSFTYNLVECMRQLGVRKIKVINHKKVRMSDIKEDTRILFSPGPALPKDHPSMAQILDNYAETHAILGVCLGHQAIGVWCGAPLAQLKTIKHGHRGMIDADIDDPLFRDLPSSMPVGLYHSWMVTNPEIARCTLKVTARSAEDYIMAMHLQGTRVYGVQFHPESFMTTHGLVIMRNWLAL